jgi:ribosomal protein L37AE/L43A
MVSGNMEITHIHFKGREMTVTVNDISITTYRCPLCKKKMITLKEMLMVGTCKSCRWLIKKLLLTIRDT